MRKGQKLTGILLAFVIMLSCLSVGFIAFADDAKKASATEQATEEVTLSNEDVEALQDLEESVDAGITLTDSQKEKLAALGEKIKAIGNAAKEALTSEDAVETYNSILSSVSDFTAEKTFSVQASKDAAVSDLAALVEAGDGSAEGAEKLVTAYNALSESSKSTMDIVLFDAMYHIWADWEKTVEADNDVSNKQQQGVNAHTKFMETFKLPVNFAEAIENAVTLASTFNAKGVTAQAMLEAFSSADTMTRQFAGFFNITTKGNYFNYPANGTGANREFMLLAIALGKEKLANEPFAGEKPEAIAKPDDDASTDEWLAYKNNQKALAQFDADKKNYETACTIAGMDIAANSASEYKAIVSLIKDSLVAFDAFNESSNNLSPAKKVVADFEKLSTIDQMFVQKNKQLYYAFAAELQSDGYTYKVNRGMVLPDLYSNCKDISQYDLFQAFIAVVNETTEPYSSDKIAKCNEAYWNVPDSLRNQIPADVTAKFQAIRACIGPDEASLIKPDLSVYTKTNVFYPDGITKEQVNKSIPRIEKLLTDVVLPLVGMKGGLKSYVQTNLYTNQSAGNFAKTLDNLVATLVTKLAGDNPDIGGLVKSMVDTSPNGLAKTLVEDKYAAARTALQAAGDSWDNFKGFSDGDMNFNDGDREGFMDAISVICRPLSLIFSARTFENVKNTYDGTYTYGGYEALIPIFEMLGLREYVSSVQYTEMVAPYDKDSTDFVNSRVRPILTPIFDLIDDFAAQPLETLLEVLPKLAYTINSGLLDKQVGTLLSNVSIAGIHVPIPHIDLSTGALFDMIAPMLADLNINGKKAAIKLNKDEFVKFISDVSGCGNAVCNNSIARGTAYSLGIETDKPDTFVTTFRYLFGVITQEDNLNTINGLIDNAGLGKIPTALIKKVLSDISAKSADEVLVSIVKVLAPSFGNLLPGKDDSNNNGNGGNENGNNGNGGKDITNNPSIPKTAGKVSSAIVAFGIIAGLSGVAVALKKKQQSDD